MFIHTSIQNTIKFLRAAILATLLMPGMQGTAWAGEITALKWDDSVPGGLQLHISGQAEYRTLVLEGGKRLRVVLPDSSLGSAAGELGSKGNIKGAYPYLADGGASVNVDILANQAGALKVNKAPYGYLLVVSKGVAMGGSAATATVAATTPAASGLRIEEMSFTTLPGSRVQLRMKMSGKPVEPKAFKITNPARLAFDFPGTTLAPGKGSLKVGVGSLVSVKAIEAEDRTRVVLNLVRSVGYQQDVIGNTLVVTLDGPTTRIAAADDTISKGFISAKAGRYRVQNIDFRRGPLGDAKLIVTLSDPSAGVDIKEQSGDIVLDFLNTSLPPNLERRLDVVDFATPVQTVDVFGRGKNTRMVVTPTGKYEHLAYQTGNVFTLNVKQVLEKEEEKKDEFGYSGEKLSLNFQNIEARAALQVLADFTGLNFVVSDSVQGELTLRLKDVPWDQAMDLILDAKGLGMRKKGNVITVAPAEEMAAKDKAAFEAAKVAVELEPLTSELIQINYAKAEDIAKLLKSVKAISTGGAGAHPAFGGGSVTITKESTDSNSLLSPRGQVTIDRRTNSVLIQDTPGKIREVRKLISKLDQPVQQVLIESRLVEATDNFSKSLGAKFGVSSTQYGSSATVDQASILNFDGATLSSSNGLNVNLPSGGIGTAPAGSLALTLAKLGTGSLLSLELSALEQEGEGKIISSPRIVTANGQKAKIEQGQERVFTTSVLGVGTVVTKKAVLSLEVTPRITPDDRIIMDVIVSKDNFADAREGILNVKDIETQVLLNNGETVVIGGIYEMDKNNTETKVPFFGELPLLGWMFKNKELVNTKTELLIFLTPKILADLASAR
jgi:type IV pilus assembly protein PilQ